MGNNYKINLLIISNDNNNVSLIKKMLKNYTAIIKESSDEAITFLEKNDIDIVIIDNHLKDIDGIKLLIKIKQVKIDAYVILITSDFSDKFIAQAIKNGAYDYIHKPVNSEELLNRVNNILETINIKRKNFTLNYGHYFSDKMISIIEKIKSIALTELPVLISGEPGCGKEMIAGLCHYYSKRKKEPVSINCSLYPKDLLEAELFGETKSVDKAPIKHKIGLLESAEGGSIFIKEITELPDKAQVRLLRLIKEKIIRKTGDINNHKADIRIIASTTKNIDYEIITNSFMKELLHKFNFIRVDIPPLRLRREEIKPLAQIFLNEFCSKYNKKINGFEDEIFEFMVQYSWPGNIRELKNKVEQAVILAKGEWITENDFINYDINMNDEIKNKNYLEEKVIDDIILHNDSIILSEAIDLLPKNINKAKKEILEKFEKEFICYYLKKNNWKVSLTAKEIGLYRQHLYKKLNDLDISIDKKN